jgi:hypothetical protein
VAVLREHLEVIQFLRDRGFGNAVQKLTHARVRAGAHLLGGSERNNFSFVDEDHAVSNEKRAGEFVRDHNDGHVKRFLQFENELINARRDDGIESRGRLVKKKNFRVHGKSAGDGGALLHPAAQLRRKIIFVTGEPDLIELEPQHDFDGWVFKFGVFAQRQRNVFADGHRAKERATLKAHAHVAAKCVELLVGNRGKVFAFNPNFAGGGTLEPDERAEKRALAGTRTAKDDQRLALLDIKRDAMQNLAIAITDAEIAERNGGRLRLNWRAGQAAHYIDLPGNKTVR